MRGLARRGTISARQPDEDIGGIDMDKKAKTPKKPKQNKAKGATK